MERPGVLDRYCSDKDPLAARRNSYFAHLHAKSAGGAKGRKYDVRCSCSFLFDWSGTEGTCDTTGAGGLAPSRGPG